MFIIKKSVQDFFLFILLFFSIFNLSLPFFIDLLLPILIFYILKNNKSIFLVTILIISSNFFVSFFFNLKLTNENFYRPDEKFNLHFEKRYIKNIEDIMDSSYGDIYNMGKNLKVPYIDEIKEKRLIKFMTDNYGLRNNTKLQDAKIILAGDSFIVGTGNSQENIPSNILSEKLNINVANIAYPTNPITYEENILKYFNYLNSDSKIFVFYFEGNDFYQSKKDSEETLIIQKNLFYKLLKNIWEKYQKIEYFKNYYLSKIYPRNEIFFKKIRVISLNINNILLEQSYNLIVNKKNVNKKNFVNSNVDNEIIKIFEINNIKIGFFNRYIKESKKKDLETYIFNNEKILKKIQCVVFIPTKYRVYSKFLNDEINYNSALDYLIKEYTKKNIKVCDLTKTFQSNADKYLKLEKFLFWKDDTHWNTIGIDIAMEEIKKIYLEIN
jgi:hypothetical protein